MCLPSSLDLFRVWLEHLEVKRALEEIGNLACDSIDGNLRWRWIPEYGVELVEVRSLECYVVPVFLECLFV